MTVKKILIATCLCVLFPLVGCGDDPEGSQDEMPDAEVGGEFWDVDPMATDTSVTKDGGANTEADGKGETDPDGKGETDPDGKDETDPDGKDETDPDGKDETDPDGNEDKAFPCEVEGETSDKGGEVWECVDGIWVMQA